MASCGLMFSVGVGLYVAKTERAERQAAFEAAAAEYAGSLEYAVERYSVLIRAAKGLFEAVGTVSRADFDTFSAYLMAEAPSFVAVEWAPRVTPAARERFEAAERLDGLKDFRIHAQAPVEDGKTASPVFVPILYIHPMSGNRDAVGMDLASHPEHYAGLLRAASSGQVTVSPTLQRVQSQEGHAGMLMIAAVSNNKYGVDSLPAPWHRVAGFVVGAFRVDILVERALRTLNPAGFDIHVFDGPADATGPLLHIHPDRHRDGAPVPVPLATLRDNPIHLTKEIPVADRAWTLVFTPTEGSPLVSPVWRGWVTFIICLAATILASSYLWSIHWRSQRIEQLNAALGDANLHLTQEVAARAEAEAESQAARRQVEAASLARTKFFAAASHDLRQPLQAARLFAHLLKIRLQDAKQIDLAHKLEESLNASETLLKTLLDISTLEAGTVKAQLMTFEIREFVERLGREYEDQVADHGLALRVRTACDALVVSDPALLHRMVSNLLSNAIRYTQEGGILLACRRRGDCIRIEVWDSGIGIPPDKIEEVFEDFRQLDGPARSKGLGLGLSVVARMARLLQHHIEVHSQPGHGSMFAIVMPVADGADRKDEGRDKTIGEAMKTAAAEPSAGSAG